MKTWFLIAAHLRHHLLRTALTILSVAVAFLLFAYLAAIQRAFGLGAELAGANRLVVASPVAVKLLPLRYEAEIEAIAGVVEVMPMTFFVGTIDDRKALFSQFAVRPDEMRTVYPTVVFTDEELERWVETRTGAIVGRVTAERYDLEVGDHFVLGSEVFKSKDGSPWDFEIVGIYEGGEKGADETLMFFRQDYFDENRARGSGFVLWLIVVVEEPDDAPAVAEAIDAAYVNSDEPTRTESEAAFMSSFAAQLGDIGAIVVAILSAVFFTILLVAGNTMMQSLRERTSEFGLMKAVGFTDEQVALLVLAESMLLAVAGGAIGLVIGIVLVGRGDPTGGMLPAFYLSPRAITNGVLIVLALGLVTGLVPAHRALRLTPVDALRTE